MTALRAFFAGAAAREAESREKYYPEMIAAGEIARDDAEADTAAWRAIAALFAAGTIDTDLSWAQLELATSRALQRREDELQQASSRGEDPKLAGGRIQRLRERRDVVYAIHERITWYRWFWTQLGAPAPVALIAEAA